MASLIGRIKRFFQRLKGSAEALTQESYEIPCSCGKSIKGLRRPSWIEAECESCFETVFVLPANVYPSTRQVPSQVLGNFKERFRAAITELFPPREKPSKKPAPQKSSNGSKTEPVVSQPLNEHRIRRPGFHPIQWLKNLFSPVRMILLAVICIMIGTGYWLVQKQQIETAQQVWKTSPEQIDQLLADQQFGLLSELLEQTVEAGILLGKQDEDSRRFRNLQREVTGCRLVSANDLLTAVDESYDEDGKLKLAAASLTKERLAAGYFVFDGKLAANDAEGIRFGFGFPGSTERHGVEFEITMPQLAGVIEQLDGHLLFAARIDEVSAPPSEFERWLLKLDPESFALLTEPKVAGFFGLPIDDSDLEQRLQAQRKFVQSSSLFETLDNASLSDSDWPQP